MYPLIRDFSIVYVVVNIGYALLELLTGPMGLKLYAALPLYVENMLLFLTFLVVIVVPPAYVGARYAKQHGEVPSRAQSWKLGFYTIPVLLIVMTITSVVVHYIDFFYLTASEDGSDFAFDISLDFDNPLITILIITASLSFIGLIIMLVHVLPIRWLFPLSARRMIKRIERQQNST